MRKGAQISDDKKYRWWLSRIWDDDLSTVLFVMLNPSTADSENDDPTVRRCIGFAKSWGFGGVYICNVYGYRAADPRDLHLDAAFGVDIVGDNNLAWVQTVRCYETLKEVVFAWGNNIMDPNDSLCIEALYPDAVCLGKTKEGNPKHPLYLSSDVLRVPFVEF